jgi:hypothetical protein
MGVAPRMLPLLSLSHQLVSIAVGGREEPEADGFKGSGAERGKKRRSKLRFQVGAFRLGTGQAWGNGIQGCWPIHRGSTSPFRQDSSCVTRAHDMWAYAVHLH